MHGKNPWETVGNRWMMWDFFRVSCREGLKGSPRPMPALSHPRWKTQLWSSKISFLWHDLWLKMTYDDLYYVTYVYHCIPIIYLCHLLSIYVNFIQFPQRSMKISDSLTLWFSSLMESLGKVGSKSPPRYWQLVEALPNGVEGWAVKLNGLPPAWSEEFL